MDRWPSLDEWLSAQSLQSERFEKKSCVTIWYSFIFQVNMINGVGVMDGWQSKSRNEMQQEKNPLKSSWRRECKRDKLMSGVGFEPTPPMESETWTQRLRPLSHPDKSFLTWQNFTSTGPHGRVLLFDHLSGEQVFPDHSHRETVTFQGKRLGLVPSSTKLWKCQKVIQPE